jgi:hypothetical protein
LRIVRTAEDAWEKTELEAVQFVELLPGITRGEAA